jgi:hypothetical protein
LLFGAGTPELVVLFARSHTAGYLAEVLARSTASTRKVGRG